VICFVMADKSNTQGEPTVHNVLNQYRGIGRMNLQEVNEFLIKATIATENASDKAKSKGEELIRAITSHIESRRTCNIHRTV